MAARGPTAPASGSSLGDSRTPRSSYRLSLQYRLRNHNTPLTLTRQGLVLAPASGFDPSKDTQVGSSTPRLSQPALSLPGLSPSVALPAALCILLLPLGSHLALALGVLQPCPCPWLHPLLHLKSCPCPHSGVQLVLISMSAPSSHCCSCSKPCSCPCLLTLSCLCLFSCSHPFPIPVPVLTTILIPILIPVSIPTPSPSLPLVPLWAVPWPPWCCPTDVRAGD